MPVNEDPGVNTFDGVMPRTLKASVRVPNPFWVEVRFQQYYIAYCPCWDRMEVKLDFNDATQKWEGTDSSCGGTVSFKLSTQLSLEVSTVGTCIAPLTVVLQSEPQTPSDRYGVGTWKFQLSLTGDCCRSPSPSPSYDFGVEIWVHNPAAPGVVPEPRSNDCGCPPNTSPQPVRLAAGELVHSAVDLDAPGYGVPWGHSRSFLSGLVRDIQLGQGSNWEVREWSFLVPHSSNSSNMLAVMGAGSNLRWFKQDGGYAAQFGSRENMTLEATAKRYRIERPDGSVEEFSSVTKAFRRYISPAGNTLEVTALAANNFNFGEVQRTFTDGGNTTVESFLYEYDNAASANALLTSVTLRRAVNGGAWQNVSRAVYTYYDYGNEYGTGSDLKTAQTQAWNGSAWASTGTTLYRYWVKPLPPRPGSSSSSSSGSGEQALFSHVLKYIVLPAAYDRLAADPNVTDPVTASNEIVALYADFYFKYNADRKVERELVRGGSSIFTYAYHNCPANCFAIGWNI